jgi:outer membrane protein TolC
LRVAALAATVLLASGCHLTKQFRQGEGAAAPAVTRVVLDNDNGGRPIGIDRANTEFTLGPQDTVAPRTTSSGLPDRFVDLTLDEALATGLQDTRVLRSLNARVLVNPLSVETTYDAAITDSNPNYGSAAALSRFDAVIQSGLNYSNDDEVINNEVVENGATEVRRKLTTWDWVLSKTGASGTNYSLTTQILHDFNNSPSSVFPHSWRTLAEATIRKPLLQGSGLTFNRIAGPNARPGFRFSNGILISQLNNEITAAEFERGIRDYIASVITAYWDLYYAYRIFSSARSARDVAYDTWMSVKSRYETGLPGGEADAEAQAREQYYEFQQLVNDALAGQQGGVAGVLQAEANLRRLLGLPQTGDEFLRPVDKPLEARVAFDWDQLVDAALACRVEIRQQLRQIRRRELELRASQSFTLPRLDAVASWRNNGFGDDLIGAGPRFASAAQDASRFDHDEWEFGLQYNVPLGFRQAHAAVRHAELNLQRDRAVLEEQGKQIVHDLGSAYRQLDRAFNNLQFSQQRFVAARKTVEARTAAFEEDLTSIVDLLQAQRRLNDAENQWYRARAEYTGANYDVLRESGRLLGNLSVSIAECEP